MSHQIEDHPVVETAVKMWANLVKVKKCWVKCLKATEPLRGGSLLFITKFPEISGTYLIGLQRMKDWVDLGATQWFWTRDSWIGNLAPQPEGHCSKELILWNSCLYYKDPLILVKFCFISYVAGIFKSYLVSFETDIPMVPFMSDEIKKMFRKLCSLVLKP